MKFIKWAVILNAVALLISFNSAAYADEWKTIVGVNKHGLRYVRMLTRKNEFSLEFSCDEHDWQDHRLSIKFSGISLPRLDLQGKPNVDLQMSFVLKNGVARQVPWSAELHQKKNTDPTGAWMGSMGVGDAEISALSSSLKVNLVNSKGAEIYSFGAKNTSAGAKAIRKICKLGKG